MRNDFKIALSAHPGGIVDQVVRQFGTVSELDAQGWAADSEVVVFECSYTDASRRADDWRSVLDQGKTLGLIGLQAEERALLQQIVGRSFKASITNLFIRRSNARPDYFTYTIVPDVTGPSALDPAEVAEFLARRVFTQDSGGSISLPPEPTNNMWPSGYDLYSSVQPLITNLLFQAKLSDSNLPPMQSATLSAQGYFFWGNGKKQGDGRYHAIIISRINGVNPIAGSKEFLWNCDYGYALTVSARAGGVELHYPQVRANATQPRTWNSPAIPNVNLGGFICTQFGYDPIVEIDTQAAPPPPSVMIDDYRLQPNFQQYVNQLSAPGIENFYVAASDTPNTSGVLFSTYIGDDDWTPSAQTSIQPKPGAAPGSDEFVVVSYLDFAPAGPDSYDVEFIFQLDLTAQWSNNDDNGGGMFYDNAGTVSVPINLVKATAWSGAAQRG